jgi:hypothetical protein
MAGSRRGSSIEVSTLIEASPDDIWDDVEDISSHAEWMTDAVAIRFTGDRTSGVGTTFECDTAVGPFRLTDLMEVTEWHPGRAMGVRHVGVVRGDGVFRIEPVGDRATRFTWTEELAFPWWMGGRIGGMVGTPVLRRMWRKNLRALKDRVEGATGDR